MARRSFYEASAASTLKTYFFFVFFFFLVAAIGWVFLEVTGFGELGLGVIVFLALLLTVGTYFWSDRIVLAISGAREASHDEFTFLDNTVEGLALAAGVPKPRLFVIEDSAINAFATGRDPKHGVICVTTGSLKRLNRQELEGVLAHEMSHIANFDTRVMMFAAVFVGITALLSDWMLRAFFWGGVAGGRGNDRGGGGGANTVLLVVAIVLAILSPIVATIIKFAISREREYLADATGAKLTRYPAGLADALSKIAKDTEPLEAANSATAHLYISDPLKNNKSPLKFLQNMFATHPDVEDRIKRLRAM